MSDQDIKAYQVTFYPEEDTTPVLVLGLLHDTFSYNYGKVFIQDTARGLMYNVTVGNRGKIESVLYGLMLIRNTIKRKEKHNESV